MSNDLNNIVPAKETGNSMRARVTRYINALKFRLKPGSPIKLWQLYAIMLIGYFFIPIGVWVLMPEFYSWVHGYSWLFILVIPVSFILTDILLRTWLHYIRGSIGAAEVVFWWLLFFLLFAPGIIAIAYDFITGFQYVGAEVDTNGKLAQVGIGIGIVLFLLYLFISGDKQLKKLQSDTIKDTDKKKLFQ